MILVKCDREECDTKPLQVPLLGVLPVGWHYHAEGSRTIVACSTGCFAVVWSRRMWRERRGRTMEELQMSEEELRTKR